MNVIQGIKGFLGTSLVDFPGRVAAVVFLSGCNMHCPFCHNALLLGEEGGLEDLRLDEVIGAINRRRKLLDGIVVTGGEPTCHAQLTYLLRSLRTTQLTIKLDTNGLRANILKVLCKERLVDYVAVDIKTTPERYPALLQAPPDAAEQIRETVAGLKTTSGIHYEFRTTCVPGLVTEQDIMAIARLIEGAPAYYLQQYMPIHVTHPDLKDRPPYPREVLERFQELARPFVREIGLRNL
ncbi:anaerobic ribonucleoside-triphosphate reductase activating protein [candidate division FCPU426 bacterium]|nr:anaerobic ribonucleoside-triphosphate reductase activating protein [candidate division FCPU426 bacterium]